MEGRISMQRIRWTWGVGLLGLGLTVAAAPARELPDEKLVAGAAQDFGAEQQQQEDLFEEDVTAGPSLEVELGRSPTQLGYAIRISGGAPRAYALVTLSRDDVAPRRSLVALDEHGAVKIVERNASPGGVLRVAAAIPPPLGTSPASLAIRSASLSLSGGTTPPANLMLPGDVAICEIMKDPSFVSDALGEWFEVRNRSMQAIDMEGWTITDAGSNSHVIHGTG